MVNRAAFKKQQRLIILLVGLAATSLMVFLVLQGRDSLNLFVRPSEVEARGLTAGTRLRLGGLVVPNSLVRDADGITLRFVITDCRSEMVVRYKGLLPDLFREGQEVVTDGLLTASGGLEADSVLAKHDENYAPPGTLVRDRDGCQNRTPDRTRNRTEDRTRNRTEDTIKDTEDKVYRPAGEWH